MNVFNFFLNAVFPRRCPLCDKFSGTNHPCIDCSLQLQRLEADANLPHIEKKWFSKCRSCFAYDGPVKEAIHSFKYNERLDIVRYFSGELASGLTRFDCPDVILPVPLHLKRLAARGFNQSVLLTKHLSKKIKVKAEVNLLMRERDTRPQVGLSKEGRFDNVKGAFLVDDKYKKRVADKHILLIDDVLTTGATLNECARVLIKSGCKEVSILTVARTL